MGSKKLQSATVAILVLVSLNVIDCSDCSTNVSMCNNGTCISNVCYCLPGFTSFNNTICMYQQKDKLTAFLISLLIGQLGADWFYLSQNNAGYIAAGFFKLFITVFGVFGPGCICGFILIRHDRSNLANYILLYIAIFFVALGDCAWWLADFIRILMNTFKDGNGQDLSSW
jgi:hypothetical protein